MWQRRLRLWSGLVIAGWVVVHFFNHGLGVLSLDVMEVFRLGNARVWQSPAGTVLLYAALSIHFSLGLWSLYRRRTLRMPLWEGAQLGFGLLIPVVLLAHITSTRMIQTVLGFDVGYPYVVSVLWSDEWLRYKQMLLIVVVWTHFCIGIHFWLRLKAPYRRAVPVLYALAVTWPVLALAGFISAGLESAELRQDPDALAAIFAGWNEAKGEQRSFIESTRSWLVYGYLVAVLGVLILRQARYTKERGEHFRIRHVSGDVIMGRTGQTVLEALRHARVRHASVCGGRGRCTTCRVRIGSGIERLAPPSPLELDALRRIEADPNVRLACQTRPSSDLDIAPLVRADAGPEAAGIGGGVSGREQQVAIMFLDLRESTRLGEGRFPYDVVFILNLFFSEMAASLRATGGHYAQFSGDGLMALYGMRTSMRQGCRQALRGAVEMGRRLDDLNQRLAPELETPLRMGIGIHCGDAIVGSMGPPASPNLSAVGDNVNIAARLENQSKTLNARLIISAQVAEAAGIDVSVFPRHLAPVRGREVPVPVHAISDLNTLFQLLESTETTKRSAPSRYGAAPGLHADG